ncbi:hypothetical protein DXG01_001272 [Tephrocybe rancida]|nr:hypothetical protein DXG01_001272 [Tephrocybe rancida]
MTKKLLERYPALLSPGTSLMLWDVDVRPLWASRMRFASLFVLASAIVSSFASTHDLSDDIKGLTTVTDKFGQDITKFDGKAASVPALLGSYNGLTASLDKVNQGLGDHAPLTQAQSKESLSAAGDLANSVKATLDHCVAQKAKLAAAGVLGAFVQKLEEFFHKADVFMNGLLKCAYKDDIPRGNVLKSGVDAKFQSSIQALKS